ncbi:hypothetical protein NKG94_47810 [Micromonospora sp. M12]
MRQAAERPVVGILLRGSHARRAATAQRRRPRRAGGRRPYAARRAYLAESAGQVTHVSVAARDVRSWVHRLGEPADWAFGLPVTAPARLLWADPHWRPRIDLPVLCQPAEAPRLEELIATLGKAAAARAANDRLGVRLAVADLARLCPSVLRPANPSVRVHSRRAAFAAALELPVAPPGYRADMLLCLGLRPGATGSSGRRRTAGRRHAAADPAVRRGDRRRDRRGPGGRPGRRPAGPLRRPAGPTRRASVAASAGAVSGARAACGRIADCART